MLLNYADLFEFNISETALQANNDLYSTLYPLTCYTPTTHAQRQLVIFKLLKPEIRAEVIKQTRLSVSERHLSVSERFRSARHPLYKSNRIALFEPVADELVKPELETNPCNFPIGE